MSGPTNPYFPPGNSTTCAPGQSEYGSCPLASYRQFIHGFPSGIPSVNIFRLRLMSLQPSRSRETISCWRISGSHHRARTGRGAHSRRCRACTHSFLLTSKRTAAMMSSIIVVCPYRTGRKSLGVRREDRNHFAILVPDDEVSSASPLDNSRLREHPLRGYRIRQIIAVVTFSVSPVHGFI